MTTFPSTRASRCPNLEVNYLEDERLIRKKINVLQKNQGSQESQGSKPYIE